MKRILILMICALALGAAGNASAQEVTIRNGRSKTVRASGKTVTEVREVGYFAGVKAGSGIKVEISRGAERHVSVTSDRNIIDYVRTDVKNGVLSVGYANNVSIRNARTTVYIVMPEVESLSASSGSDIDLLDTFEGQSLTVKGSSAGKVTGVIDYGTVKADASSGGGIRLRGRADTCRAEASSGGAVNLSELQCANAEAAASSGGSVSVHASYSITGKASSGGYIRYAGDPKNMDIRTSSGGAVGRIRGR